MKKFTEKELRKLRAILFFGVIFAVQLIMIVQVVKHSIIAGTIVVVVCSIMDTFLLVQYREENKFTN